MKLTASGAAKPATPDAPTRRDRRTYFPVGGPSNDGKRWMEPMRECQPCPECGEPCVLLAGRGKDNRPLAVWLCDAGCKEPAIWLRAYDAAWALAKVERGPRQAALFDKEGERDA